MASTLPEEVRISSKNGSVKGVYSRVHTDPPAGVEGPVYQHRRAKGKDGEQDYLYRQDGQWIIGYALGSNRRICETEKESNCPEDPTKIFAQQADSAWAKTVLKIEKMCSTEIERLEIHSKYENIGKGVSRQSLGNDDMVWADDECKLFLWYGEKDDSWYVTEGPPNTPGAKKLMMKCPSKGATTDPRRAPWKETSGPIDGVSEVWWEDTEVESLWKDPEFPPTQASLDKKDLGGYKGTVQWIAARDLDRDPSHEVLYDTIDPSDLVQGTLGDCWLVAAIAAVAEFPYVIQKLFPEDNSHLPKDGKHEVKLFDVVKMEWRSFVVDEYVPCKKRHWYQLHGVPLFSRPVGHEMWVLLLEKAFAKLVGGYHKLKGGQPVFAWQALTGVAEQRVITKSKANRWDEYELNLEEQRIEVKAGRVVALPLQQEEGTNPYTDASLYAHLLELDLSDHVMAGTIDNAGSADFDVLPNGLVPDHVYSIINCRPIDNHKFLQIRNPHGRGAQWNGAWSENDDNWSKNPGLKETLGAYVEADHATFWMEFSDFVKEFNTVQVCPHNLSKSFAKAMTDQVNQADDHPDQAHRPNNWGGNMDQSGMSMNQRPEGTCADRCCTIA